MNTINDIVFPAIDEINLTLPAHQKLQKSLDTQLIGKGAWLDSIQLMSFVLAAEDIILDLTGQEISLVTEDAMSRPVSPLTSIRHFADYVEERLKLNV
jgi:hypothetical protein